MAPRRAIPWSETSRVAPHLPFRMQARNLPRFGSTHALLGWSGSYAGEPCLDGSAIAGPLRYTTCSRSTVDSSALSTVRGCLGERGSGGSGGMEERCERVGERTKELKLADRRGECLCQPSLGISSPLPARSSRRLSLAPHETVNSGARVLLRHRSVTFNYLFACFINCNFIEQADLTTPLREAASVTTRPSSALLIGTKSLVRSTPLTTVQTSHAGCVFFFHQKLSLCFCDLHPCSLST